MNWTYHHDDLGVDDFPHEVNFPAKIYHYWTSDSGTRIGFYGNSKQFAIFTYRKGNLNFEFTAHSLGKPPVELAPGEIAIGPVCSVLIHRGRKRRINGKAEIENRLTLFDNHPFKEILDEIKCFLRIFELPSRVKPVHVEEVIFPNEKNTKNT